MILYIGVPGYSGSAFFSLCLLGKAMPALQFCAMILAAKNGIRKRFSIRAWELLGSNRNGWDEVIVDVPEEIKQAINEAINQHIESTKHTEEMKPNPKPVKKGRPKKVKA